MSDKKDKQNEEEVEEEEEEIPERELTEEEKQFWIRNLPVTEGCFDSPINLNLSQCVSITLPKLVWVNFDVIPKKTKISNTGHTLIFSAKWAEERPYIRDGPFTGKYVFSNFHLHWGPTALAGSEHTIDGGQYPAEMHVVLFKSSYLTQEAALKEQDGCATLAYVFKIQDTVNPGFEVIIKNLRDIWTAGTSKRIENICILRLFREFVDDYFMYWGSVSTENCIHYVLWLITRQPIGISNNQLDALRNLFDDEGLPLLRNYRNVQDQKERSVFVVNPSTIQFSTILPISNDIYLQYQLTKVFYFKDFIEINELLEDFLNTPAAITDSESSDEDKSNSEFHDVND